MSERFINFVRKSNTSKSATVIIPDGKDGTNTMKYDDSSSSDTQIRSVNSYIQVHSLYITQNASHGSTTDCYASLYIADQNASGDKFYVAHDFVLKPQVSFFVEKNITLMPSQSLYIEYPVSSNIDISISSSCVEITD